MSSSSKHISLLKTRPSAIKTFIILYGKHHPPLFCKHHPTPLLCSSLKASISSKNNLCRQPQNVYEMNWDDLGSQLIYDLLNITGEWPDNNYKMMCLVPGSCLIIVRLTNYTYSKARGVLSGKVGIGMCGPDRVLFRPLTLLDHCLKSLHNTVKHMNLPTVV